MEQHDQPPALGGARILVVAPRESRRAHLAACIAEHHGQARACTPGAALDLARGADAAIIDCPDSLHVFDQLRQRNPGLVAVVVRTDADADFLSAALRLGVAGVTPGRSAPEVAQALAEALDRRSRIAGALAREHRRARRLRLLCKGLLRNRADLLKQVCDLCEELAGSFRNLSDQVSDVSLVSEFNALIRQELDLEGLLRTTLEFALRRVGAMNAAIYIPNSVGDFSLGAYVNYDCPRDGCEDLLEGLSGAVAAAFAPREEPLLLPDGDRIAETLGRCEPFLAQATMLGIPCRCANETGAIAVFFRDYRTPFSNSQSRALRLIGALFAAQLSRVIRTHNRHLPKGQWSGPWDRGSDDIDLAA
jgi:hypothetical protein